ncbi:hypothetical protein TrVE_jg10497 [Triparma verrucosa]|uniref:Uncharacterized protein n=1 Tax=Triparma verrucosa TaxID=1606542 RepID=A0A9W7FH22_9STRA|nr:hypothetical protein TrVE_jg10497 [Triparma verrucosa]
MSLFSFLPPSSTSGSSANPSSSAAGAGSGSSDKPGGAKLLKPALRFKPRAKAVATAKSTPTVADAKKNIAVKRRRAESLEVIDIHAGMKAKAKAETNEGRADSDFSDDSDEEMYDPSRPTDYNALLKADALKARQKEEAVLRAASENLRRESEDRQTLQRQTMVREGKIDELREIEKGRGRGGGRGRNINNLPSWMTEGGEKL